MYWSLEILTPELHWILSPVLSVICMVPSDIFVLSPEIVTLPPLLSMMTMPEVALLPTLIIAQVDILTLPEVSMETEPQLLLMVGTGNETGVVATLPVTLPRIVFMDGAGLKIGAMAIISAMSLMSASVGFSIPTLSAKSTKASSVGS